GHAHGTEQHAALRARQPVEPPGGRHRRLCHRPHPAPQQRRRPGPGRYRAGGRRLRGPAVRRRRAHARRVLAGGPVMTEHLADAPGNGARGDGDAAGLPVASFGDPHLQPMARDPRRAERVIALFLLAGLAGFAAYGGLYWVGGQTQWEGIFLGVGLFAFGFGLSAWGKYLLPQGPFVEDRHSFASSEAERQAMTAAVE